MPDFEAISHTWGPANTAPDVEVVDDDSPSTLAGNLKVGNNLRTMLIHLRESGRARSLWIDANCINQKDLVERGEHVKEMRSVYAFASRVLVWLGEGSQDSALALRTLEFIGKQTETTPDRYFIPAPDREMRDCWHSDRSFEINPGAWRAIAHMIMRPYLERLWIAQEIQMANRHSTV
jgi:hypothetical protein